MSGFEAGNAFPGDVRVYRISSGRRFLLAVLLFAGMCLCGGFMVLPGLDGQFQPTGMYVFGLAAGAVVVALLGCCLFALFRDRIEVHPDRLRKVGFFKTSVLPLADIRGYRILSARYGRILLLLPKTPGHRKMKIELILERQKEFLEWLKENMTDLDAADYRDELAEVLANEELGETPEQRLDLLHRARKWANILNGLGFAVMLWVLVKPEPYEYALWSAIILPLAALVFIRRFHGALRFDGDRKNACPNAGVAFVMPCIALALRVLLDFNILSWNTFWLPFAAVSTSVYALVLLSAREVRRKRGTLVLPVFFCALYGYVTVISLNGILDYSAPTVYRAQVVGKRISGGRHTSHYLNLSPWGPRTAREEVDVGSRLYDSRRVGDSVDIVVKQGRLGIPWFFIR